MSDTIGTARDLDASRKEALQGLLGSLGYPKDDTSPDTTLSAEQTQRLSEKTNEILGDGVGGQRSQLLNEDGLPIVDISEPVNEDSETSVSLCPEQELIPLFLLAPDERERQRRERDRILDLLEKEEHFQQLQDERDAEEERKEAIKKRKESAKVELEQLKAARELQKKMGRALVQYAKGTTTKKQEKETNSGPQPTSVVAKKSVSFVDAPAAVVDDKDEQTSIHGPDWGDVTPGRLPAKDRVHLVSAAEAQKYPMKMHVVERCPMATPVGPSHRRTPDSDDESPPTECSSLPIEACSPDHEEGSSGDESLDDGHLEEFDYDAARHYREIALEYHKKRRAVGAEAAKALAADTLDHSEEQKTSNGRSPLSHFRADRMAAAYNKSCGPISTLIGQTVIPASSVESLQNSVKLGKLDNNHLAWEDSGESGSEDETVREVMQVLQTRSIQNAGPDFKLPPISTVAPHQSSDVIKSVTGETCTTTAQEVKPSRFKLTRKTGTTERATIYDNGSGDDVRSQPTISNVVERKAPRCPPSQRFPINKPPPRSSIKVSEPALAMIVDPLSFPMAASTSNVIPSPSTMEGSHSSHQTQLERPPRVEISGMQDSMIQLQASSRDTIPCPI